MQIFRVRASYKIDGEAQGHDVETHAADATQACNKVLVALKRVLPEHTDGAAHLIEDTTPEVSALEAAV
jgi:hypothetical protein